MRKLLYAYEKDMPTVSIFRESVQRYAVQSGSEVRFKQIMEIMREDISWCDIVTFIRPNDPYSVHLARCAQKAGCFVISYYDDDLYMLPESMPNPIWRKNSILKILAYSNIINSSSRYICEKYGKYTREKRSYASDTVVDASEIKLIGEERKKNDNCVVKLIYAANAGHVSFFNQFIMPIMPQLCKRYAGKISMTFMGVRPKLSEYESQIDVQYFSSMPLAEYRHAIQAGNYDIGLSPMTSTEFTKCKYFNKFIEYTMAGIVGVYSKTEPYTQVVEHKVNGFLVADDPDSWYDVLCLAIDDTLLRNSCIRSAQKLLLTEFNPDYLISKEEEQLPELKQYSSEHRTCGSLLLQKQLYRLVRVLDKAYLVLFYLKHTGITGLIEKTKTHLRERTAYLR